MADIGGVDRCSVLLVKFASEQGSGCFEQGKVKELFREARVH